MDKNDNILKKGQKLLFIFLLFLMLFTWPLLSIFNVGSYFFGMPDLYVYFFVAWAVLILLLFLATRSMAKKSSPDE